MRIKPAVAWLAIGSAMVPNNRCRVALAVVPHGTSPLDFCFFSFCG
jgi:hypothetical protein